MHFVGKASVRWFLSSYWHVFHMYATCLSCIWTPHGKLCHNHWSLEGLVLPVLNRVAFQHHHTEFHRYSHVSVRQVYIYIVISCNII